MLRLHRAARWTVVIALSLAVTAAFTHGSSASAASQQAIHPKSSPLKGGVLATFDVVGQHFKFWTKNGETIHQLKELIVGRSEAHIPNGPLLRGAGRANYNKPYNWHLDPEKTSMAEMTIELCDAEPSFVEKNIDYFVDTVKHYCPWGARLIKLQIIR